MPLISFKLTVVAKLFSSELAKFMSRNTKKHSKPKRLAVFPKNNKQLQISHEKTQRDSSFCYWISEPFKDFLWISFVTRSKTTKKQEKSMQLLISRGSDAAYANLLHLLQGAKNL